MFDLVVILDRVKTSLIEISELFALSNFFLGRRVEATSMSPFKISTLSDT